MSSHPIEPGESPRGMISTWGIMWRGLALVLALAILAVGQVRNDDDLFPLGSLAQYATGQNLNGSVRSVYMTGDFPATADSEPVLGEVIPLASGVVGVGRGEVEGQLQRFVDDPSLLAVLARAYGELNPGAEEPDALYLERSIRGLKDGSPTGEETIEVIAEWHRK